MVAKLILPLLGGSPAVWNTCVVFFQTVLLLGYGYAHVLTTAWKPRYQLMGHSAVLLLPLPLLPIALLDWMPPTTVDPIGWLLALLTVSVGLPFFVISTTAPLVQKWFAYTQQVGSRDPYFLYAASNVGSLVGLLSYPLVIEPNLTLTQQRWLWAGGYGLLMVLVLACAVGVGRSLTLPTRVAEARSFAKDDVNQEDVNGEAIAPNLTPDPALDPALDSTPVPPLTIRQQGRWVLLAAVPSSLLLGVTTYLTTDLAAVPLLWAVPLAIYLLTFVIAFARPSQTGKPVDFVARPLATWLPLLGAVLLLLIVLRVVQPVWLVLPLHLLGLLAVALVFHGQLARERPHPQHLTAFYFWIALGGVLGGVFNAIAAPLLFSSVVEYPLMLLVSLLVLLTPTFAEARGAGARLSLTLPLGLSVLGGGLLIGLDFSDWQHNLLTVGLSLGLLLALRAAFQMRVFNVLISLALVVLLIQFSNQGRGNELISDRSFFGVYRVISSPQHGGYHSLLHGTTLHGKQSLDPARQLEPLTYFSQTGPVGQLFESRLLSPQAHVGVLGLGVGTLATYAQPEQTWVFYEIDPLAKTLALNPDYFTFLQNAVVPVDIVLGDGRLALAHTPDPSYDLLFMDAFSSDSIPVHLMTQEAIQLYLTKLSDRGILAINITNRYLNLEPIVGALAQHLNLVTLEQQDAQLSDGDRAMGKTPSHWVLMARRLDDFGNLATDPRWHPISTVAGTAPWTDDFSNIVGAIKLTSF